LSSKQSKKKKPQTQKQKQKQKKQKQKKKQKKKTKKTKKTKHFTPFVPSLARSLAHSLRNIRVVSCHFVICLSEGNNKRCFPMVIGGCNASGWFHLYQGPQLLLTIQLERERDQQCVWMCGCVNVCGCADV
jgi:hypothetical protein